MKLLLLNLILFAFLVSTAYAEETRVFTGGKILTADAEFNTVQAMAIRGKVVLAVGSNETVLKTAGKNAERIDLKGNVVLPGFIDGHNHMIASSALT